MRKRLLHELAQTLGIKVPLWYSFDVIGDLALLKAPFKKVIPDDDEIEEYRKLANELLEKLPYVKGVFLALTPVEGEYRLRKIVHLAGKRDSTTIYREHGCVFYVDLAKAYISPRLSFEHARIASLVSSGEVIINMFSGVGGFSIVIAKKAKPSRIVSIDINPSAFNLLVKNIVANKVEEVVVPVLGDAVDVVEKWLIDTADRVLMPLPSFNPVFYSAAVDAIRGNGFIHAYEFQTVNKHSASPRNDAVNNAYERIKRIIEDVNPNVIVELTSGRIVRSVGPRLYQVVLDLKVRK